MEPTYQEWLDYFADLVENTDSTCFLCFVLAGKNTHPEAVVRDALVQEFYEGQNSRLFASEHAARLLQSIRAVEAGGERGPSLGSILRDGPRYSHLIRPNARRAAWLRDGAPYLYLEEAGE